MKEQKVSDASVQEAFPVEQKTEPTGSETPMPKDEGDKQKEYFRHVQKLETLIGKSRRIRLLREEKFPNKSGQQLLKEKND